MRKTKSFGAAFAALGLFAAVANAQVINEIRVDQIGTDNDEYFEIAGTPGASLTGLHYIVIGDGASTGIIESVTSLAGQTIPADGYFLCAEPTFVIGGGIASVDFVVPASGVNTLAFENTDNVTHLLVSGFTGATGNDLDTNDDCVLDVTPWTAIVDSVSFVNPTAAPPQDCFYATGVGPDRIFWPGWIYRCPDTTGGWGIGAFDPAAASADETPGSANATDPFFVTPPAPQTVCAGASVTISVVATGVFPLSYQWRKDGVDIFGATSDSISFNPVTVADAGSYDVVVTDSCPSMSTSAAALLTVNDTPLISTQPQSQDACVGGMATFSVVASGGTLSYQWYLGGAPLIGEIADTLTIDPVTALDGGSYTVEVLNLCGSTFSDPAVLTVENAPSINTQPTGDAVCEGDMVTFLVSASGSAPISFQWRKGGVDLAGETANTLVIDPALAGDSGTYDVVVSNDCGSVTSDPAVLVVTPFLVYRQGNVNITAGPVVDVLLVNGSAGPAPFRKIVMSENDPFTMTMSAPPSKPSARYAAYAWLGEPTKSDLRTLPMSLGTSVMPMPISAAGPPNPKKIWNNIGKTAFLGVPDFTPPVAALSTMINKPGGIGKVVTFTVQGLILDSNSLNGDASVTNAIIVELQ